MLSGCWWFCAGGYVCSLPAVAIDALKLWAGGYACSLPAWNGCRVPAGSIRVLRLCAGGYVCSRPAVAIGVLVLCAGGCGCRGTDAAGQLVLSGC